MNEKTIGTPREYCIHITPNDGYGGDALTSLIDQLRSANHCLDTIKKILLQQLESLPTGGNTSEITDRINGLKLPKNGDYTTLETRIERILTLIARKLPPIKE